MVFLHNNKTVTRQLFSVNFGDSAQPANICLALLLLLIIHSLRTTAGSKTLTLTQVKAWVAPTTEYQFYKPHVGTFNFYKKIIWIVKNWLKKKSQNKSKKQNRPCKRDHKTRICCPESRKKQRHGKMGWLQSAFITFFLYPLSAQFASITASLRSRHLRI